MVLIFLVKKLVGANFYAFCNYGLQSVLDSDVLNPVDSYNLIKRTARTWLKVKDALINIATDEKDDEGRSFSSHLHSVLETFPSWEKNR